MAVPSSDKCCVLVPAILLLAAALLYTGCAFRIRDTTPGSPDVCHSPTGRCSSTSSPFSTPTASASSASPSSSASSWSNTAPMRAKRGFEPVSTRGSFAKSQTRPPDKVNVNENDQVSLSRKDKKSLPRWSKLSKVEVVSDEDESEPISGDTEENDSERLDSDDEIVQIEIEDDDDVIDDDEEEDNKLREKLKRDEEDRRRREEAEKERKRREKEEEQKREREKEERERRKREEEEKRRKERELEEERRRKEEEERRRKEKEQEERRKREEEERRKREEIERRLRQEAERRLKEEEARRKREEEARRKKQEEERKRKEEEERKKKEEEERKRKEEERKKKEAEEKRLREEEERRLKEEEEERLREEEECRIQEEEERRQKEEEEKRKQEEERKKREEEKKEAERKRKEEEEQKKKEEAERKKKEKEEAERKRKEKEEKEAERKRDAEEDRKRVERLKKEAEQKKLLEEEEKKKRLKSKKKEDEFDNDEDEDEDEETSSVELQKKIEKAKVAKTVEALRSTTKAKDSESKKSTPKPTTTGSSEPKAQDTKPQSTKSDAMKKSGASETKATKPKPKRGGGGGGGGTEASLSLAELNDMILSVPTFVPNFTAVEDPACQQHGKIFLRQLRGYKLWALQMLDSSAKIPSGLLRGNVNQLGDYDQCLGIAARVKVEEKTVKVQGKYCLASIDLYATHPATKLPVNLMQSRALIRGNMRDPAHFVPRFTTANWAICLPAACSAEDALRSIQNALEYYNATVGIRFVVDVDPEMCYVKQKSQSYSKETIGVLYFYAIFVCLSIVATLRDYLATVQKKGNYSERIIMAFSLKRTLKALFGNKEIRSSDIGCIHGIRSLSTIALYIAHKLIPTSSIPYANRVEITEIASNPLSSLLRASLFYTDSFLLLSGVLTAYHMARELSNRGEIRWFCRFIARFVRLTPSLLAVVFWYAFVMEHTGSGPQWNAAVKANADICKENAWINLLYVQNFFPFEEMCAHHTHQLALDMQLSLAAPALVFFLQIKPVVGIIIVFFLVQVSATVRYLATTNNNLSLVIFHGMTMKHLFKTANMSYTLPLHRATPYLFGVSLGVLLRYIGKNIRIHKVFVIIGWVIALASGAWSLFSPWRLARRDYVYEVEDAAQYAVISPILTAVALSWTIFACFTKNGGIINKLLTSRWMVVFSRLSYAIYLSQFAVFFYNVGVTRYSTEFQPHRLLDLYEIISVVAVSIVLTLLFDIPMQEVKNIIMESSDSLSVESSEESKDSNPEENDINKTVQDVTPEEEEPGGRNWNRGTFKAGKPEPGEFEENGIDEPYRSSRLKRQDIRRQTMIRSEAYDEWDGRGNRRTSRSEEHSMDDGRMNRGDYRMSNAGIEDDLADNYLNPRERYFSGGYTRSPMRDLNAPVFRRSVSRERAIPQESENSARDYTKKPLITISKEEDYMNSRSPRSSMPRFSDHQRSLSSESDLDIYSSRRSSTNYSRRSAEPRISDEDDWEEDLRIRRMRYLQERVSSQERDRVPPPVVEEEGDQEWNSLKRRSSAEGKMALLKEPIKPGNMELWTVSKMQLGSSQEPDDEEFDEEMYLQQRREYREQGPPLREEFEGEETEEEKERRTSFTSESLPTSFEEEDDVSNYDFVLKKDSKRITVQDLSKLSPEEEMVADNSWNKLDVKSSSTGLFKRESIVKSQASEEDPEYLLPERPKLVEQEQEHPFKKAWQMQKSRSEEEGTGFIVKESSKPSAVTLEKQKEEPEEKQEEENREGGQSAEVDEPNVTCDVTFVWQARSKSTQDSKSISSKSETSSGSSSKDWTDNEEQFENHKNRRKSEDENWTLSERDT